jgi:flagellar protein FliS
MSATANYRELEIRSADPLHLVVLLYDQLIRDISAAAEAATRGDVIARTQEIDHAMAVITHLQATLNTQQGQVASDLVRFYEVVGAGLLNAQLKSSAELLRKQLSNVITVREAWVEVEQKQRKAQSPSRPAPYASDSHTGGGDWKA